MVLDILQEIRYHPRAVKKTSGEVAEWSKATDLKSVIRATVSRVRISPSPPEIEISF